MTTLVEYMILSGAENRPPMLGQDYSGLAVPMFKQGDDPIDAFTVVTSHFQSTNNQLRNSSNQRQQATIHEEVDVIWQDSVQSQRGKGMLRGSGKKFYWSKLKEMVCFSEKELGFLADPWYCRKASYTVGHPHNAAYQVDDLDAYDSDCDEISTAKAVLMANLSSYGSDVLSGAEIRPMLYDGNVIAKKTNVISIAGSKETLMLVEESRSKMILKQCHPMVLEKKVNTKPIKYAELNQLSEDFGTRFVPRRELSNEQASHPITDQYASLHVKIEAPRELPKTTCFEIQVSIFVENDRLLDQIISQDIVNIVVNSSLDINTSMNMKSFVAMNDYVNYVEMCNKCLELKVELIKQHNMVEKDKYNRLSKSFSKLEQHYISLELAMQLNKEIFQKNNTSVNQTEPSFDKLFDLNNLKAELQAKDITIRKLKANIKCLNKTFTTNSVKKDIDEIETINTELEHKVTKLIAENEHLKQTYKQLYDSIKPSCFQAKEHAKSKFKEKYIVDNVAQVSNATTIAPRMYKLDPVTLAPKDKNNRETHIYYLKHTMEQAAILMEIVEQAKSLNS
ncbi:hypothetical protein Tco_0324179 [Tanacetum coccineum]